MRRLISGRLALALACTLVAALVSVAPASAHSRGFEVHNQSDTPLRLFAVKPAPAFTCPTVNHCSQNYYPMEFEGRPADGSVLLPFRYQRFELKWSFNIFSVVQYAADLYYRIGSTGDTLMVRIETYPFYNRADCSLETKLPYVCGAGSESVVFRNLPASSGGGGSF